ncbi:Heat shock factor protein [Labeo rohita]|uniref:Heat shock factor protein n=1 Tax=Labeo rohita TaxID=84645 RepID=A0ABQ8LSY6_LABRO|nr:Heat shock factor protein [Labeo rohita]
MAMLARAAESVGLEWKPPLCPEPSRLDDWYLGPHSVAHPPLPPLMVVQRGGIQLSRWWSAVAMQLCSEAASIRRGNPLLPSRACSPGQDCTVSGSGHVHHGGPGAPSLANMRETDKTRFLNAPVSQTGLFGDAVENFAQRFSTAQKHTEAIRHNLPRHAAATSAPPPAPTQPSQQPSQQCRGAGHRAAAPPVQARTKTSAKRKSKWL